MDEPQAGKGDNCLMDEIFSAVGAVRKHEPVRSFAKIGAVYRDGVSLIFDGEATATKKHYLCNTSVSFKAGDRVRISAVSGTYVVEYVVGPPKQ